MNEWVKKNFNLLLIIFILLQPILDVITGINIHLTQLNITIGIFIRMLFLIFICYTSTVIFKKRKNLIFYSLLLLYFILYIIGMIFYKDSVGLFAETQGLLRVFYFPILLISLYSIKEHIKISKMTLTVVLLTYLLCIFIPNILQLGFKSYEITKVGTLGFFNSANEISGIISILTPIMISIFTERKNYITIIITSLLYFFIIMTIGTKTPLLSLVITLGFCLFWLWGKSIKKKSYKIIGVSLVGIVLVSTAIILILPKTNFYKNIKTHLDYLKVDDIGEVLEKPQLIDHFIFSQRLTFLKNKQRLYQTSTTYQKVFGIGYLKDGKETKAIEMDYFDIYYSHGIIGFLLYFAIYGYILLAVLKNKREFTFSQYMLYISLLLVIFLSFFTGHIITAPAVSILVIVILLLAESSQKKRLVFTAYDLRIGGIEKALVELVNRIELDKYEVTIILEHKTGEFLSKIRKDIIIKEFKVSNCKNLYLRKFINLSRQITNLVLNYNTYDFSCCYATYSLSGNKLAKVLSANNSIYIHSNYKYVYQTEQELRAFFDPRKLNQFCHIIFVSNEAKEGYLEYYPENKNKTMVCNNFINIEEIKMKSNVPIVIQKPKNKKLFVFVGRLDDSSKKVGRAINLIKELKDTELWIIGDGPDKKQYEEIITKNKLTTKIKLLGMQKNPYPYMKQADYLILTSEYEGFPVTYLEGLVLEKPFLTTIPVSDESLEIGKDYGIIIPKEEAKMVKKVQELLTKKQKIKPVDLERMQRLRMKKLERLFDEVR